MVEKYVLTSEDNFHPRKVHEVPEGEWNYSSILSLITVLDIGWWQSQAPATLSLGKISSTHCTGAGWAPGLTWTSVKNLSLTGI